MKDFYLSYPILSFITGDGSEFQWFASEYFYESGKHTYCLAVDPYGGGNEILIGASAMKQNMIIFDVGNEKLGFSRANCSQDINMILSESEVYAVNKAIKIEDE
mmetsp:Transcript_5375/g.6117  ORF Transcript_5375/g.6117 Transcript_5375/m.6117 type:complete len:104 (-) Transcript_5375:270-581(-)